MKNKFLMLSLLVSLFFIGCSGDDDGGSDQDSIIGTWQFSAYTELETVYDLTACDKQTTWTFNENGTYSGEDYFDDGSGCEVDNHSGTWENKGNNVYEIMDSDEIEPYDNSIVFSNNNNTMTAQGIEYTETYTRK